MNQHAGGPQSGPQRRRLEDRFIRGLKPGRTRFEVWDALVVGFGVRVAPTGRKVWMVRYRVGGARGVKRREVLGQPWTGTVPTTSLEAARGLARARLELVGAGLDPVAEDAKAAAPRYTVADLAREFLADGRSLKAHRRPWRGQTGAEFARMVARHIVPELGAMSPDAVTRRDIQRLLDSTRAAPHVSNRLLVVARLMWRWGVASDRVETMPAWPLKPAPSAVRQRDLSEDELRAVWDALDHEPSAGHEPGRVGFLMSCAFKLLLLTAQRRGEVLRMRWCDLATDETSSGPRVWWTIPAPFTKALRRHRVPLSPLAAEVVESLRPWSGDAGWVFPSRHAAAPAADPRKTTREAARANRKRTKRRAHLQRPYCGEGFVSGPQPAARRLWERSGVTDAQVRDFRRTAASLMASLQVPTRIIGKVLNHAESTVTGIHYDVYAYDAEKAAALDALAVRLSAIVGHPRTSSDGSGTKRASPSA